MEFRWIPNEPRSLGSSALSSPAETSGFKFTQRGTLPALSSTYLFYVSERHGWFPFFACSSTKFPHINHQCGVFQGQKSGWWESGLANEDWLSRRASEQRFGAADQLLGLLWTICTDRSPKAVGRQSWKNDCLPSAWCPLGSVSESSCWSSTWSLNSCMGTI